MWPSGYAERRDILGHVIVAFIFVADRLSKAWLMEMYGLEIYYEIEIARYANLVLVWNEGVSFGMLRDYGEAGRWILVALSTGIVVALAVWMSRNRDRLVDIALGLVIGGAIGNIYDRLLYGAVLDFIDLHVGWRHWPAFNVADAAITLGVALLLWDSVFRKWRV